MKLRKLSLLCLVSLLLCSHILAETIHTVQKSDTLYSLSRKYGLTVSEIQKANNMGTSNAIKIGQKLVIPADKDEKIETQKDAVQEKSQEKNIEVETPKTKSYTVVKGDTLYSIAKKSTVSVDDLRKMNSLTATSILKIGQVLTVPYVPLVAITPSTDTSLPISTEDPRSPSIKKGDTSLIWPVKALSVEYVTGKISGVSLTGKEGESVTAIRSGTVIFSGIYRGFGQVIFIQDTAGYMYVYTGLSKLSVNNGTKVDYGQVIGIIGHDSFSGKDSMDFMVYKNSSPIDPADAPRG